jgi:hypothetical protein
MSGQPLGRGIDQHFPYRHPTGAWAWEGVEAEVRVEGINGVG